MIIIMERNATEAQTQRVINVLKENEFEVRYNEGNVHTVIDALGDKTTLTPGRLAAFDGVKEVKIIREPFRLASRDRKEEDTVIEFSNGVKSAEITNPFQSSALALLKRILTDLCRWHKPQKKWAVNSCVAELSSLELPLMIFKVLGNKP